MKSSGNPHSIHLKSSSSYLHSHYCVTGTMLCESSYFHELTYLMFKRTLIS